MTLNKGEERSKDTDSRGVHCDLGSVSTHSDLLAGSELWGLQTTKQDVRFILSRVCKLEPELVSKPHPLSNLMTYGNLRKLCTKHK